MCSECYPVNWDCQEEEIFRCACGCGICRVQNGNRESLHCDGPVCDETLNRVKVLA